MFSLFLRVLLILLAWNCVQLELYRSLEKKLKLTLEVKFIVPFHREDFEMKNVAQMHCYRIELLNQRVIHNPFTACEGANEIET